jgi:hypothetical protein
VQITEILNNSPEGFKVFSGDGWGDVGLPPKADEE